MSLLDRNLDVAHVYVEVEVTDSRQETQRVPADDPVFSFGTSHPVSSERAMALGQDVTTLREFTTRSFPGGPWSRVVLGGRDWEVVGEPEVHRRGAFTKHVNVTLHAVELPPLPPPPPTPGIE